MLYAIGSSSEGVLGLSCTVLYESMVLVAGKHPRGCTGGNLMSRKMLALSYATRFGLSNGLQNTAPIDDYLELELQY